MLPQAVLFGRREVEGSGQRQYGMRSLPNASTHDQQWESNPRPDLESNALSTWPHALDFLEDSNGCKYNFLPRGQGETVQPKNVRERIVRKKKDLVREFYFFKFA